MRTIHLLLLVGLTALEESCFGLRRRSQRELLSRSKRRWVLSTIELQEEDPGPYPKEISQMFHNRSGNHEFHISGMGVDVEPLGVFSINPATGIVFAHRPIDRETYSKPFNVKFHILDKWTKKPLDKELSFDVQLKDINDNAPTFYHPQMKVDVKENVPEEGDLPVQLQFTDRDQANTSNSRVTITVISQAPKDPVIGVSQINGRLAQLTVKGCFNYDKIKSYQVTVQAKDHGVPPLSSTAVITLNIVDSNTHPPTFKDRQYQVELEESTVQENVLRVAVVDNDTPDTPGWRAKYYFIAGNEDGSYNIETDPDTNEGILSVIKGKDYEQAPSHTLQIGVENEEALWICEDRSAAGAAAPDDSASIVVRVTDVNDPPVFLNSPADVYHKEEEKPGKVLCTPEVEDADSDVSKIRYVVLDDPAGWVTVDKKTGQVISAKKMDRESPLLNGTNTYRVLIGAIDDGEPPATGTGTVSIHLVDINDNVPHLVRKRVVLCGNKADKVTVPVEDADAPPFSGPFSISLGGDDGSLEERWRLEPAFGEEGGLVSRKSLAYGNYSVPLEFLDQQNMIGRETLQVTVCDCGEADVCRRKRAASSGLGAAGVGLMFLGLLLFLLLLLLCVCDCGRTEFKHIPGVQGEGNQTLIKYNQEGGASECKTDPHLLLAGSNSMTVTNGRKQGTKQLSNRRPVTALDMNMFDASGFTTMTSGMSSLGMQQQRDTLRSLNGQTNYSKWISSGTSTYHGGLSRHNGAPSLRFDQRIANQMERRLKVVDGRRADHPEDRPREYAYEGQSSRGESLDGLSLSNTGNDLTFLNDLGPKFMTLGGICQPTMTGKSVRVERPLLDPSAPTLRW